MTSETNNADSSLSPAPVAGRKTAFDGIHPSAKLIVLVGLVLCGIAVFSILGIVVSTAFYHLNVFGNPGLFNDLTIPGVIPALKIIQTASALGAFVLPALFFARMSDRKPLSFLNLDVFPKAGWWPLAILTILSAAPLINLLGELNSRMNLPAALSGLQHWMMDKEAEAAKLTAQFLKADGVGELAVNLIIVALLAAIGEELLFRGVLQNQLFRWMKNKHAAIWVTAIVFSAFHMQFFGFLPRMAIGALLGYFYVWSGSLWVSILTHFTNNAFGVIVTYLIQHKAISVELDTVGNSKDDLVYILLSLVLTSVFIVLGWKIRTKREELAV
jgi:hypothetical protein